MFLKTLPSALQPVPPQPQGALRRREPRQSLSDRGHRQRESLHVNCSLLVQQGSRVVVARTELPVLASILVDALPSSFPAVSTVAVETIAELSTIHGDLGLSDSDDVVPESGILCDEALRNLDEYRRVEAYSATVSSSVDTSNGFAYSPAQRNQIRESWDALMRWSKVFRTRKLAGSPLEAAKKIIIFGGGSFGTAMGCAIARQKADLEVVLLVRDPYLCRDINTLHENTRYLKVCKVA